MFFMEVIAGLLDEKFIRESIVTFAVATFIAAVLMISVASGASAQILKTRDLAVVSETSRQNEARFDRDYRGKRFEDRIAFAGMEKPLFGGRGFDVRLGADGFLHAAECRIADQPTIDRLIDRNVGDVLTVSGTVERTIMGIVMLEGCTIR